MEYITPDEILEIHDQQLELFGGAPGIRDPGALSSALAQPSMTFDGRDLYPDVYQKAAALGYSLIQNHPFVDGNKRTGFAAMHLLLQRCGYRITANTDECERIVLAVATGQVDRAHLAAWLEGFAFQFR